MSQGKVFTLDDLRVQVVKSGYDSRAGYRKNLTASFEELFKIFQDNNESHADIAVRFNTTCEAVRQIYEKYFRQFCGDLSGHSRTTARSEKERLKRAEVNGKKVLKAGLLCYVVERAIEAGCAVEACVNINCRGIVEVKNKTVLINGNICSVHHLRCSTLFRDEALRQYACVSLYFSKLSKTEFSIFDTRVPGYPSRLFVVPNSLLLQVKAKSFERHSFTRIAVPLGDNRVYNNIRPVIDWAEYQDAWHQLTGPRS